jgi:hypothetical protein
MKETEVVDRLARIETHLENYNKLLSEHVLKSDKRTTHLEEKMEMALLPIKASKFLVAVCAGAASVVGLLKLLGKA